MKRLLALVLALAMLVSAASVFAGCEDSGKKKKSSSSSRDDDEDEDDDDDDGGDHSGNDISKATCIEDLKGFRIAAMADTFHADALSQISEIQAYDLADYPTMLAALMDGTIDGFVVEEPTAIQVCLEDDRLDYLRFVNNDTGFKATVADVGIAVGLKTGDTLREQINEILAGISVDTRSKLMEQMVRLSTGREVTELALQSEAPPYPTGTLKVAMECAYAPFNWTDTDTPSLGAVPISSEGKEGLYANGYDVQIARYIANKLGMKLEVYSYGWDGLISALNSGAVDAIIAGMSPTAEREEAIDFTDVYHSANLVVIYQKNAPDNSGDITEPVYTEPVYTEPVYTEPAATEAPDSTVVSASRISNHENGWEVEAWSDDASGLYFNMWANDLPYNTDWSVEYAPLESGVIKLIRNGNTYEIGDPMLGMLVKFSANSYSLRFDRHIIGDLFPLQNDDVIVVEGSFTNAENGWTIIFEKVYCHCKEGGITKFTTEDPNQS